MERIIQTEKLNGYEFKLVFDYLDENLVDEYLCYIFKNGRPMKNNKGEPIKKSFSRFHECYYENFIKKFSSNFEYRNSYINIS